MDPYEILGLSYPSSKEEIKSRYYELAKKHHPDKLQHLSEEERKLHEEKFKKINVAYELLSKEDFNKSDWKGIWSSVESFMNTSHMTGFADILSNVINIAREYKKRKASEHHITVEVTLEEVHNRRDKKCRLFLKNISDPIFITVDCGCYPSYLYTHMHNNQTLFIYITFQLQHHPVYSLDTLFDTYDLYTETHITLAEYFTGTKQIFEYLDGTTIEVNIPAFSSTPIHIQNKGLFGKDILIIVPKVVLPEEKELSEKSKMKIIKYLTGSRAKTT